MKKQKKIGNNIVCNCCHKKYVWGDPSGLSVVPSLLLLGIANLAIFFVFLYGFMSIYFQVVISLLYIIALIHYVLCYVKDPGIVPKEYPKYKLTENEIKEILEKKGKGKSCYKSNDTKNQNSENKKENNNVQENNNLIEQNNVISNEGNDQNAIIHILPPEEMNNEVELIERKDQINDKEKETINQNKELINVSQNEKDKEQKKSNEEGKEVKEENADITPRIFTIRKCETCFINRQPTVSHCSICDNCVVGFDQ